MLTIRKSEDRGLADHGWLKSFHSFSFAEYFDPQHMGWGNLRVINEDRIAPGTGFGTHGHRDFNHAQGQQTHFLQIWIEPNVRGIAPSYEQKTVPEAAKRGQLALVAAPEAGEHTVQIHADARLYAGLLDGAEQATLALDAQRKAYVFVVRGSLRANGQTLNAGDAAMLAAESALTLDQAQDAEVLVF